MMYMKKGAPINDVRIPTGMLPVDIATSLDARSIIIKKSAPARQQTGHR